uniref:START domain-containing protein n=1 Tax=Hucho hucho TaxID=62062 RepID=A0A4W5N113_9TELE
MSLHFTDEEFLEFFTETMGVKIYRLHDKVHLSYCFETGIESENCCVSLSAVKLHEKDYDGHSVIYWEVKYPFPLSNRDYVYVRERRDVDVDSRKIWVVLSKMNDYKQTVAMESDGACGTKVFMNYFDNPGGNIPSWLVNWAAKSGVPAFLTDMQKACGNYSNYCQKNKK